MNKTSAPPDVTILSEVVADIMGLTDEQGMYVTLLGRQYAVIPRPLMERLTKAAGANTTETCVDCGTEPAPIKHCKWCGGAEHEKNSACPALDHHSV